jgi:hypothetical protein
VTRRPERVTPEQIEAARPRFEALVVAKAKRFSADSRAGYEAGCIPLQRAQGEAEKGTGINPPSFKCSELGWVYGVAERDVPPEYYSWHVIEGPHGAYELVLTTRID